VKREIAELKQEIDDVKARVKVLEGKTVRNDDEKDELKQKRPYLTVLLANLSDVRKKEAQLEDWLEKERSHTRKRLRSHPKPKQMT
jgi:hypothetical protein